MKRILIIFLISVVSFSVFAQDIPEEPNPPRLVNDLADVLTDQEEQQLESDLVQFNDQTSTQIAILTVSSLNGYEIADFSTRVFNKWEIGQEGKNNGILIVFKPKTVNENGRVFVVTGYGLEGILPDAVINRNVVDYEMIPRFKEGDIYGGLYGGCKVIKELAAKEYTAADYEKKTSGKKKSEKSGGGIVVIIMIIIVLASIFKGGRGGGYTSRGSLPFWLAMGLLNSGSGRGSWGGFSGGSGGFGGGGGGFGGFGGGMSGGGGAGGSW